MDKIQDASGAASSVSEIPSSANFSDGSQTKDDPPVSESPCDSSLHSRDNNNMQSQEHKNGQKKMTDSDKEELDDTKGDGVIYKKGKGFAYYPLLHYKKTWTRLSITNITQRTEPNYQII